MEIRRRTPRPLMTTTIKILRTILDKWQVLDYYLPYNGHYGTLYSWKLAGNNDMWHITSLSRACYLRKPKSKCLGKEGSKLE
jgi:hypothetical protein